MSMLKVLPTSPLGAVRVRFISRLRPIHSKSRPGSPFSSQCHSPSFIFAPICYKRVFGERPNLDYAFPEIGGRPGRLVLLAGLAPCFPGDSSLGYTTGLESGQRARFLLPGRIGHGWPR